MTPLHINARIGRVSQVLTPAYGACYRCGTTWAFVRGHSTPYSESNGCFPLCEACWAELTPDERLPYYRRLWLLWQESGSDQHEWAQIEAAVRAGK